MAVKLTFESDIERVIARVERFAKGLPGAMRAILNPSFQVGERTWKDVAVQEAERVLRNLADTPAEHELIPAFVRKVSVVAFGDQMEWSLSDTREAALKVLESLREHFIGGLFAGGEGVRRVQQLVQDWVRTPESEGGKRRDARDAKKSDDEIARGILIILLDPSRTEGRSIAAGALLPHLQKFADLQAAQNTALPPEKVNEWLRAVLEAWREQLVSLLPEAARQQIRQLWASTAIG